MKYEIKGKQIFVFERKKTSDNRHIWQPKAVFQNYTDLQNSVYELAYAGLEVLKAFKKLYI